MRLISMLFLGVLATASAYAEGPQIDDPTRAPIQFQVVPVKEVRAFLLSRFRTPLIRELALSSEGPIARLIEQAARYPLFTFQSNAHPAARLNFTAFLRALNLREGQYADPLLGDLYLLHELHHITTMPYERPTSYATWHEKMTLNEKESTLFSEAIVHLEHPEIRAALAIPTIWVDRFLTPDFKADYFENPGKAWQLLLARFTSIGNSRYESLDPIERRSWLFDRSNEIWSAIYWPYAAEIESHMRLFYMKARLAPMEAAREHVRWLNAHTTEGMLFKAQNLAFNSVYARLNAAAAQLKPAELERLARGLVEDARVRTGVSECGRDLEAVLRSRGRRHED